MIDPDKTVLIVGHKTETVRRAKGFGLNVILLQHKTKLEPEQAALADMTCLVDYTDWDTVRPLVKTLYRHWGFRAAISLTEPGLDIAGRINDLFGLGGTSYEVSHRLRDKWAMRRHLAASGARSIGAALVQDRASLGRFGAQHGYPFIVKPTDMTAGFGVLPVQAPVDVDRVWSEVQELRRTGVTYGTTLFSIDDFLMEEYVEGPEFSVEGFSFAGRHVLVTVTEKLTDPLYFAELGHTVPARIDASVRGHIMETVKDFLDVMGVKDGPSHTEVRVGTQGPVVIESHNRIGGDHILDLVKAAFGVDLADYTVGWPFGLVSELPDQVDQKGGACVRFLHGGPGQVAAVGSVDSLARQPDVLVAEVSVQVGDLVRPLRNNWDRLGLVAVVGADSDTAAARCEELVPQLPVTIDEPAPTEDPTESRPDSVLVPAGG
jgi:hypothetical protein